MWITSVSLLSNELLRSDVLIRCDSDQNHSDTAAASPVSSGDVRTAAERLHCEILTLHYGRTHPLGSGAPAKTGGEGKNQAGCDDLLSDGVAVISKSRRRTHEGVSVSPAAPSLTPSPAATRTPAAETRQLDFAARRQFCPHLNKITMLIILKNSSSRLYLNCFGSTLQKWINH